MPALFQPSPILQVQHLCLHLSTLKHEREWLADAVLATDTVSVDANRDNGASLRGTRKSRRGDGDADRRLAAYSGAREEAKAGRSRHRLLLALRHRNPYRMSTATLRPHSSRPQLPLEGTC